MKQDDTLKNLCFHVQGSRSNVYTVTFQGAGQELAAFCTCPAGKKAGIFCKHVAMLLKGDTAKLVDGTDKLPELHERVQGSPLIEKAKTHKAAPPKPEQIDLGNLLTLKDLAAHTSEKLAGLDNWCEYSHDENEMEKVSVCMRKYYKNGKPYKNPTVLFSIAYEPYRREYDWNEEEGLWIPGERQKKVMPWNVNGISYGKFKSAAFKFLNLLDALLADKTSELKNDPKDK